MPFREPLQQSPNQSFITREGIALFCATKMSYTKISLCESIKINKTKFGTSFESYENVTSNLFSSHPLTSIRFISTSIQCELQCQFRSQTEENYSLNPQKNNLSFSIKHEK